MKAFKCGMCGFVSIDGSAPEKCPVCGAPKKMFKESEVKTSKDIATYGESEKKHIPSITISKKCGLLPNEGCIDINVKIGEITHPMLAEHYIMHIDFYIDTKYVSRMMFSPDKINPAACLHIKVPKGKITVIEQCNIHGDWMNETDF
ncbi:MAG: desulfoferrodoxin family protein [Elusimicrobia bacterium]|nr:desulfoferrodoxin family protein [Elusimicrobiota bacterium]